MPELLATASSRKDWKKIAAESSLMSPPPPSDPIGQGTELNGTVLRMEVVEECRHTVYGGITDTNLGSPRIAVESCAAIRPLGPNLSARHPPHPPALPPPPRPTPPPHAPILTRSLGRYPPLPLGGFLPVEMWNADTTVGDSGVPREGGRRGGRGAQTRC